MRCAADHFINCATFNELHNISSIVQRTCNRFRVNVRNRLRVRVSFIARVVVDKTNICIKRVRLGLARIRLGLGCAIGQMRSAF